MNSHSTRIGHNLVQGTGDRTRPHPPGDMTGIRNHGVGAVAQALVAAGYPVTLSNSRGPDTLTDLITDLGPLATAGTVAQAAEADIVFLAVPFPAIPAALDRYESGPTQGANS